MTEICGNCKRAQNGEAAGRCFCYLLRELSQAQLKKEQEWPNIFVHFNGLEVKATLGKEIPGWRRLEYVPKEVVENSLKNYIEIDGPKSQSAYTQGCYDGWSRAVRVIKERIKEALNGNLR